jgi:8-amino-7-oxononanoate synthase
MKVREKTQLTISRLQREMEDLHGSDQFRRLRPVAGVNLCSNDYLGLSDDPRLKSAVMAAAAQNSRVCSTGSRLLSGHEQIWDDLESQLAACVGSEASLYFSSGYMANLGLLTAILGRDSIVFSDSANHASIIDAIRLAKTAKVVFPHSDLDVLEGALRKSTSGAERFIVAESIFSMEGDRAKLEDLYSLADRYDAAIILDEAHATGVVGPNGAGLAAASGRPDCVLATVHTCGKALASMGAFVACSNTVREYLVNKARHFIFSTALPPYIAAQTRSAVAIAQDATDQRIRLDRLSEYVRVELRRRGFDIGRSESQIVPVIFGSNEKALHMAENLIQRGFGVKAIRPPTVPSGTSRLRLSLTANLDMSQLAALVQALDNVR